MTLTILEQLLLAAMLSFGGVAAGKIWGRCGMRSVTACDAIRVACSSVFDERLHSIDLRLERIEKKLDEKM